MCMQDYAMMKNALSGRVSRTIDNASIQVLADEDDARVALVISPPPSGTLFIQFDASAAITSGMNLPSTAQPLTLTLKEHGLLVTRRLVASHSAASVTIDVWFSILHVKETIWRKFWYAIVGG